MQCGRASLIILDLVIQVATIDRRHKLSAFGHEGPQGAEVQGQRVEGEPGRDAQEHRACQPHTFHHPGGRGGTGGGRRDPGLHRRIPDRTEGNEGVIGCICIGL